MKQYFFALSLLLSVYAHATHIVGGTISYRWISGTTYEVKMTIYRDCNSATPFDGAPGATSDAIVGIFEENTSNLVTTLNLINPVITTILPPSDNPCLTNTSGACVEQGVYTTQITLPSATLGYTLIHERCCRNGTITNVFNPGDQGAVYSAYIPRSTPFQNTSPVFNSLPPLFVCVNSGLIIDYSATDADGDQLVYNLCTPSSGGTSAAPAPNPPFGPPHSDIAWQPPYDLNNLMGGIPLAIDQQSGVLTGTPSTIGQFVVGVCISEYRSGQLIATYMRDFQFNVTQCNTPISNIPSVDINPGTGIGFITNCNNATITFPNSTYNPPPANVPLNYSWNFGVQGITTDTSSAQFPTYTFPDTGTYLVSLIATKGSGPNACIDTGFVYVRVYPTFNADFITADVCQQFPAVFTDNTQSTSGAANEWNWNFGDGTSATTQNATHNYSATGAYTVSLISENAVGCRDTATKQVNVLETPTAGFSTTPVCDGTPVVFSFNGSGNITGYNWDLGSGGATSTQQSHTYTYSGVGTYTVTLVVEVTGCFDTAVQTVTVNPVPVVVATNDTMFCTSVSSLQLNASGGTTYSWSPTTGLSDPNIANPVATLTPPAAVTYTVIVSNQSQCTASESVSIGFYPVTQVNAGIDTSICLNPGSYRDSVQLTATGANTYQWTPANTLTNGNIANPVSRPSVNTTYTVWGTDVNGCRSIDSIVVFVLDPLLNIIVDDVANICIGDTGILNVINQGASSYTWTPNQFIVNGSSYSPGFYPPDTTVYYLNVDNYCYMKNDSVVVNVQPLPTLTFITPDSLCIGESEEVFVSGAQSYVWDTDSSIVSGINTNTLIVSPDSSQTYYVTATSQYGCVRYDSVFVTVFPLPYTFAGDDTLIYRETKGALNGVTTADWYEWSPPTAIEDIRNLSSVIEPTKTIQYYLSTVDSHGCRNLDSVLVTVQVLTILDLPTAFSPNGDGINDIFHIVRWLNIEKLKEFAVYNRWGNKVFSTTDILDGWDGVYLDMKQPMATYTWMVIANTRDDQEVLFRGNVTLVR